MVFIGTIEPEVFRAETLRGLIGAGAHYRFQGDARPMAS